MRIFSVCFFLIYSSHRKNNPISSSPYPNTAICISGTLLVFLFCCVAPIRVRNAYIMLPFSLRWVVETQAKEKQPISWFQNNQRFISLFNPANSPLFKQSPKGVRWAEELNSLRAKCYLRLPERTGLFCEKERGAKNVKASHYCRQQAGKWRGWLEN